MLVSELGGTLDREGIRQRMLERLEEELDAVHVKRVRTEAAGSSTEAQFASGTTESEEVLRTKQWCNRQPIIVSSFVLRVLPPRPPRRDLRVVCKCGHECLEFDFRKHVISGQHEKEFFEQLNYSEALGAQAAVLRVAEMLSDLGQRATRELMAADALRGKVRSLHSQLVALEGDLDREKRAHCLFESRYTTASARLAAQDTAMRSFTSPTARLHQELWQRGLFDKKQHPLNNTLDELHYLSLVRVPKGDDVKKGGEPLKLTPTARALATLMHAKSTASGYRLFRDVYRWPPSPDDVRRLPPFDKGGPFVAVGCHQLEWGQQAHRFYIQPLATTRGRSRSASALIPQRSWRRSRGTPRRTLSSATSSATHASASNRGPPWCASLRPICRGRLRHPVPALPAQPALPVGLCAGRHGVI